MDLTRRSVLVYVFLAALWGLVVAWQGEEHWRVRSAAKADLNNRSKDIANSVSASIRAMVFWGTIRKDRVERLLDELVNGRTNEVVKSSELISLALLNAAGEQLASGGRPVDYTQTDILQHGERWGQRTVTFVIPVDLGVLLPPRQDMTNGFREGRLFPREGGPEHRPPPPDDSINSTNGAEATATNTFLPAHPPRPREGESRPHRPPWLRGMSEEEYQSMVQNRALHGLVVAMSTESFQAASTRDLWLRAIIVLLATVSVAGSGLAWRNLTKTSDLQLRLVRASELNTHLKEMNLAAAGLAHETRNPLNIIRGLAQMISKQPECQPEVRQKSREIVDEADKVAAQLNEFINYSRPREVRRTNLALGTVVNEVVRALTYDIEEKKIKLQVLGEVLTIEADEQLLRQALFNLLLNAVQAVDGDGEIQVAAERRNGAEAWLEVRDNGPGVPPDRRNEIFKPYFTTQKTGTGLGLAVVQQIVLAHGWEIECLPNNPRGAVFRISHLKVAAA